MIDSEGRRRRPTVGGCCVTLGMEAWLSEGDRLMFGFEELEERRASILTVPDLLLKLVEMVGGIAARRKEQRVQEHAEEESWRVG